MSEARYDVEVLRAPEPASLPGVARGVTRMGAAWEVAMDAVRRIRAAKGFAHVVPVAYRAKPRICRAGAWRRARDAFAQLRASTSHRYGELTSDGRSVMVWRFVVDDWTLQEAGWAPGRSVFLVDRLTGRIWDVEEYVRVTGEICA